MTDSDLVRLDEAQKKHRFALFDPRFTTGDLLQIIMLLLVVGGGYGVYTADKAATAKELEHVKLGVIADRALAKDQLTDLKAEAKETRADVRDIAKSVNDIKATVAEIKAVQGTNGARNRP